MQIERLSPALSELYESFLLDRPHTLLYQSWRYQSLLLELLACRQETLLALDEQGSILASLPLMAMDGRFGTVLNSLPYYGSNGGLIGEDPTARAALAQAYMNLTLQESTAAATFIENPLEPRRQAELLPCQLMDERIGQFTPLPQGETAPQALMASFHYKTRNMVRKAEKLGVQVEVNNEAMPFLVEVHEENMREIGGQAKSRNFFSAIPQHFRPDLDYRVYQARVGGEAAAALLVFYYNRTVEYYTPVVRKEHRDSQALSAIIFKAMCDAAQAGYCWWNWGGTWLSQDGVYRFKSRWGTEDKRYRYCIKIGNPALLQAKRSDLLAAYPNFFTVPFSALSN